MPLTRRTCFWDDQAAARVFEACRWPRGVTCPGCADGARVRRIAGVSTPTGSFKCYACQRRFTVRTGTVLEGSHIPLSRWLRAILLVSGAGKRLGCKHIEEACGVAPRISRAMRQKLGVALAAPDPAREDLSEAQAAFNAGLLTDDEAPDGGVFKDVCRALSLPSATNEEEFLQAVRHVMCAARAAHASPRPMCVVVRQHSLVSQEL